MYSPDIRPKWWKLYLIFPLLIALFIFDSHLKLSSRGHQVVQLGIILLVYGLIYLWLKANSSALSQMDPNQYHGTITVIRIPPYQLHQEKNPMLHLPDSEIKGVLSDTFEMDYIDAESFLIDEVSQESNKE
jgi:hypothetical protein